MLNFNYLRQHLSNWFLPAISVGLAVAVHGVWIGVSGRLNQGRAASQKPSVDNTAQLVRITRRAVQQQRVAAVSLDLSASLPPPPPELLGDVEMSLDAESEIDCPPMTAEIGAVTAESGLIAAEGEKLGSKTADAAMPVVSASGESAAADSSQPAGTVSTLPPLEPSELPQIWRRALGVPIWPRQLGEKPTAAQFREVSKQDLEGRSVQELNQQSFATGEDVFRFLRLGDRLLILKETAQL